MAKFPLPPIAPVEAAMMVVRLRALISKEVETITKAKLDQMASIPKEVRKRATQLTKGELDKPFYSDLNYRDTLTDLANGFDLNQVADMIAKFPPEYQTVGAALVANATHVIQALLNMLPTHRYETVTGQTQLLPDDVKVWKFVSILEVLDDPLLVFPLMASGALLRSQAQAVRLLYPTLSACIDAALLDAISKAKAAKKSYELPTRTEVGVKAWMGQAPISKSLSQSTQAAVAKTKEKQLARQTSPAQGQRAAKLTATASERPEVTS